MRNTLTMGKSLTLEEISKIDFKMIEVTIKHALHRMAHVENIEHDASLVEEVAHTATVNSFTLQQSLDLLASKGRQALTA